MRAQYIFMSYFVLATALIGQGQTFIEPIQKDRIDGWEIKEGPADSWKVEDDVLICTSDSQDNHGWIGTEKTYRNFILEFDYKLPPGGNSGVYLRTPKEGHPSVAGMEIQILDDRAEKHAHIKPWQHSGSLYGLAPATPQVTRPAGQWNHMRIKVHEDHIQVVTNGHTVVDTDARTHPEILERSPRGPIGFQNHHTNLWIKNLKVADLEADLQERARWWQEARFGLFIHWGPVSLRGTEIGWSRGGERPGVGGTGQVPVEEYDNLYKQFNPTEFDAEQWVELARDAGMKYLVFTTKHHDGFCMFDSELTDYDIMNTPFKRDIVAELANACHQAGLPLGFYHSQPDWHHPDFMTDNHQRYIDYLHGQVRELCTRYGRVDILWFDGLGGKRENWDSYKLYDLIRLLQPHILINNRADIPADFLTPEQEVGHFNNWQLWESCITICNQWAWKPNDQLKSLKECIHTLVGCASGDGNLLLNVGPMPDGRIEPRQAKRLREIGAWLKQYGPSIYGTRGGPLLLKTWGGSTHKGNLIYLHILQWPKKQLILPPLPKKIVHSYTLTGGKPEIEQSDESVAITLPAGQRDPIDTIIVLELDGPADEIELIRLTDMMHPTGGKPAGASNVYLQDPQFSPDKAFDEDEHTRWATDAGTHQAWLEVDLQEPTTFNTARIQEAYPGRTHKFELQYRVEGEWKTFQSGQRIGKMCLIHFDPITARHVRLNILEAVEGPTIFEFQLFHQENDN